MGYVPSLRNPAVTTSPLAADKQHSSRAGLQGAVEEGWFCGTHLPLPDACTPKDRFYPSRGRSRIVWEWGGSGTLSLDFPVLAEEESVWGTRPGRGL